MNSNDLALTGTIKLINPEQQVSDNFKKREMVLTTAKPDGSFPQDILIEFTQSNTGKLDSCRVGEKVTVSINVNGKGSEKNGVVRYWNSIVGWNISHVTG